MTTTRPAYHLLYVWGWDETLDEPTAGRVISGHDCLRDAIQAHGDLLHAARRIWGDGHLVVTDQDHRPVYGSDAILAASERSRMAQVALARKEEPCSA